MRNHISLAFAQRIEFAEAILATEAAKRGLDDIAGAGWVSLSETERNQIKQGAAK